VDDAEKSQGEGASNANAFPALGGDAEDGAFPTLGAAVKVAPGKKIKGVKLSLAEFASSGPSQGSSYAPPGRTGGAQGYGRGSNDVVLPSGPRLDRPEGEDDGRRGLGGGFNEYGGDRYGDRGGGDRYGDRGGGDRHGDRGSGDRYGDRGGGDRYGDRGGRGGGGRYDRDDRRGEYDGERVEREEQGPSRADTSSNWGSDRRAPPQDDRYGDRGDRGSRGGDRYEERRGGFEFTERPPREDLGPSRADEADNWNKDKRPVERDSRYEERPVREVREERDRDWGSLRSRTRAESPPRAEDDAPRGGERPKLQLKPRSESTVSTGGASSSLFGGAKPVDVKYVEDKPRERAPREDRAERAPRDAEPRDDGDRWGSRKPSSFSVPRKEEELRESTPEEREARPKLNLSKRSSEAPVSAAVKSTLFGGARPREEALKAAGRDAALEDLKLSVGGVKRKEFKEEKELRERIAACTDASEIKTLELQLTKMSLEFDDKFRFAKHTPSPNVGANKFEKKDDQKKEDHKVPDAVKDVKPRVVKPTEPPVRIVPNAFSALADDA